jgi:molybdate/tungstate transport system substrate-binding protein
MFPRRFLAFALTIGVAACRQEGTDVRPLVLYNAAAIARPMRAVLDSFSSRAGTTYEQETASSLELARKVIQLGGEPDVIVLADPDVFTQMLAPDFVTWHALFARNRIVLAYAKTAKFGDEITSENWWQIMLRPGLEIGRSDPNTDPSGYRTLLVWQLAETHYNQPGLAERLLAASPPRNVRPREAEQIVMVETGEYDYTWTYENLALNAGLRYVRLPSAIDLGAPEDSTQYAKASVRVQGKTRTDSVTFQGKPILFAVSISNHTKNREVAERFVSFLLSDEGRRILRGQHFDALDHPVFRGPAPEGLTPLRR